jgi:hypothetical protein
VNAILESFYPVSQAGIFHSQRGAAGDDRRRVCVHFLAPA